MAKDSLNSSSDDSRRQLYEQFRSDLAEDRNGIFLSEDDLLDIFDYATDYRDRFTAFEVILCAERLYPSSTLMAERKALFCLGLDDETAAQSLSLLPEDSVMKTLLSLRLAHSTPTEAAPTLEKILMDHPELTDEEMIQLCDTAEELGMYSWLSEHKEALKAHTDYPPTFLYELCQIAREQAPDDALAILEELTMMEPFSIDFWVMIAQIHLEQGNPSKALPAIEYALAIEPANINALLSKAHATSELHYPPEQVETILNEIITLDPALAPPVLAMALLNIEENNKPETAFRDLCEYNRAHPGNPQVLDIMLMAIDALKTPDIKQCVDSISSFLTPHMAEYVDNFIEMARRHADVGHHLSAGLLLLCLDTTYRLNTDLDLMLEELYRAGLYRQVLDSYQAHYKTEKAVVQIVIDDLNDCFAAFWFILSAIREGITEGIGMLVSGLIASEPLNDSRNSISDIFESRGLTDYLVKINAYLTGADKLTPDDLDPFLEHGAQTPDADTTSTPTPSKK
ncbi:MAG: hypothetical protein NC342_04245 [Pseudoflavonifractor sp.]|nr:hypothetical protein [Pseudoflavonifractor sp.]